MMVKAIVRENIIMPDRIPTDTNLKALDYYCESFVFDINPNRELEEKLKYAMRIDETYAQHMFSYSIEFVAAEKR